MAITLNHTIVPAHDKVAGAKFLGRILGVEVSRFSHFEAVRINESLTLDYDERDHFESHHYAFLVSDAEFDAIFSRIKAAGIEYSADPFHRRKGETNNWNGGRGFYFYDPDGHNFEVLTRA